MFSLKRLRILLPPPIVIIIAALPFCVSFLWPSYYQFSSLDEKELEACHLIMPTPAVFFRSFILLLFSLYLGFFRAWRFHPTRNKQYQQWLAFTPWTYKKPLPFGPPHLVLEDILMLAVIATIGYFTTLSHPRFSEICPGFFFPIAYAGAFLLTYCTFQEKFVSLPAFQAYRAGV